MGGGLSDHEREWVLFETLNPDQLREEGLLRIPAGEPGHVRDLQLERERQPKGLGTLVLRDPPEMGYDLIPPK